MIRNFVCSESMNYEHHKSGYKMNRMFDCQKSLMRKVGI